MDRCIGLVTLCALTLFLNGCGCVPDTQDKADVNEYFNGCWDKANSKRTRTERIVYKEKEAEVQNKIDEIKKNQTEGK